MDDREWYIMRNMLILYGPPMVFAVYLAFRVHWDERRERKQKEQQAKLDAASVKAHRRERDL